MAGATFVVSDAGLVVSKEDPSDQVSSATYAGLVKDALQVLLNSAGRHPETLGDLGRRVPLQHEPVTSCSRPVRPYAAMSNGAMRAGWAGSTITATRRALEEISGVPCNTTQSPERDMTRDTATSPA